MTEYRSVPLIRSPLLADSKDDHHRADEQPQVEAHDETLFENPQFQHYEETSNIQLFFDLFFVANLTSFTNSHEVNSTGKLASYIGFFCILWFTWCQVTLYDVRFSTDSIFERLAHICHFGVMVGLAIIGPQFDDPKETPWDTLQQLSLILMASRAALFLQYSSTLYFAWGYRTARLPLVAVLLSLGIAVIVYLVLSFVFSNQLSDNAYLAWYVISVLEVGAAIAIAGKWHVVSFKGTHLTERMTSLTLIILGEGVIGLTKTITKIENLDFNFSSSTIGTIISALLIIYLVYQLYFDNVQLEHFGIIRQQIWTFLHFPFHMALVLLMEGINQFISWRHITEFINNTFNPVLNANPNEVLTVLNETISAVLNNPSLPVTQNVFESISSEFTSLNSPNITEQEADTTVENITTELLKIIFNGYGFEPPEDATEPAGTEEVIRSYYNVFTLVFGYFFISAGLVLIFIGVLSWLSHSKGANEIRAHMLGIITKLVIGLGLVFCSLMVLTDAADNLGSSAWTLPLLFFLLGIAVVAQHIRPCGFKKERNYPTGAAGATSSMRHPGLFKKVLPLGATGEKAKR